MLAILVILLYLLFSLILVVIHLHKPRYAYFWLVAAFGALLGWALVLAMRFTIPVSVGLGAWEPASLFPTSPALAIDPISWPFALALSSLTLAIVLTDVSRADEANWQSWTSCLALTALGLIAVLSGNLLTLALGWAAIDLVELGILLFQIQASPERERVVVTFSARAAGILLAFWAALISVHESAPGLSSAGSLTAAGSLTFEAISPNAAVLLLIAAGLRLGVLPLHLPFFEEDQPLRRGLGTLLRLGPVAASLVLLPRTAQVSMPAGLQSGLLVLTGLAAIYAGVVWLSARNELDGRPFWILGMSALAVASALRGQVAASLAWGTAALLSGSLVFLASASSRKLFPVLILGFLSFSSLPYTPTWQGVELYSPFVIQALVFLPAHALLLAGFVRHFLGAGEPLTGVERWVWLIYPLGLALLPGAMYIIFVWNITHPAGLTGQYPELPASWPALVSLALLFGLWVLYQRGVHTPQRLLTVFRSFFSFNWLYRLLWRGYHLIVSALSALNQVFEGEGGILWTLLLLALLFSLLLQVAPEGG